MEGESYTVLQVAELLGVSDNTVRRQAAALRRHLSAGADQRPRRYTPEDVAILQAALTMKTAKVPQSLTPGSLTPESLAGSPQEGHGEAPWSTAVLNDLYRRVGAVERAQQRAAFVYGMAAGVALCLFLLVLAWLLVNGG